MTRIFLIDPCESAFICVQSYDSLIFRAVQKILTSILVVKSARAGFRSRFSDEKGKILRHFSRFAAFVPQNDLSKTVSYDSAIEKRSLQALEFRKPLEK
jgi:hypothetical protein